MPNNDDWIDDATLRVFNLKGLTRVYARATTTVERDAERRCYRFVPSWDIQFRVSIDVAFIARIRAEAQQFIQESIDLGEDIGQPLTAQVIADLEAEFHLATLVPEATYGHERQHRIAVRQALDEALQPGGLLEVLLARAAKACYPTRQLAEQFARLWRLWFLHRLKTVTARGAGHDNDPATPKPVEGVGVPLPSGVSLPPATSGADWDADRQALNAAGYVLIAP